MGQPQPKPPTIVTLAEFFAMEWPDDRRRELHDGQIVVMAYPANAHGTIIVNLAAALKQALRGRPCRAIVDAGIIPSHREHTFYTTDLVVTCEPHRRGDREVRAPHLVIEVLSPTTRRIDLERKLPDYRELPSVREVLLIDSERMFAELHRKLDGRWTIERHHDPKASLWLTAADLQVELGELYDGLDLAGDVSAPL